MYRRMNVKYREISFYVSFFFNISGSKEVIERKYFCLIQTVTNINKRRTKGRTPENGLCYSVFVSLHCFDMSSQAEERKQFITMCPIRIKFSL